MTASNGRTKLWIQVLLFVGLCALAFLNFQRTGIQSLALHAKFQPGTCLAWVSPWVGTQAKHGRSERVQEWPKWADIQIGAEAVSSVIVAWGSPQNTSWIATVATFVTPKTVADWKLLPTQPHTNPQQTFEHIALDSDKAFTLRVPWHDYGALEVFSESTLSLSLGLAPLGSSMPIFRALSIQIFGAPNAQFKLSGDGKPRWGRFSSLRNLFVYGTDPPTYPRTVLEYTWGGALTAGGVLSDRGCLRRVASTKAFGIEAVLSGWGLSPSLAVQQPPSVRFVRPVKSVSMSGVVGSVSTDSGGARVVGHEDMVEVVFEGWAQLSVESGKGDLILVGRPSDFRVNGNDARGRRIESWPWHYQAVFWAVLAWAAGGLWSRRRDLLALLRKDAAEQTD